MPDWRLKTLAHGVISVLPRSTDVNHVLQRRLTHSTRVVPARMAQRLAVVADRHVDAVTRFGNLLDGAHVVELGTGWHPVVPLGLIAYGAAAVTTFDIDPLLRDDGVNDTVAAVVEAIDADPGRFDGVRADRLEMLRAVARTRPGLAGLHELGITSIVGDARATGLDPGSIDLVVSNNVMEHVARDLIADLYREFARITRPGGLLSQRIDMRDHFARVDRSIGPYNYLRYSQRQWKWLGSRMEHQNRIRYHEHQRLLTANGWRLLADDPTFGSTEALEAVPIHPEFLHLDRDDLRVLDVWMVATPER